MSALLLPSMRCGRRRVLNFHGLERPKERGQIDLEKIWKEQQLSKTLEHAIEVVATHAHQHIVNPPPQRRNPSEWCKREECWEAFRRVDIKLPAALEHELITLDRVRQIRAGAPQSQDVGANEDVEKALMINADTWFKIARWAKETNNLAGWQRRISFSLGTLKTRGKKPSPKQAKQGLKLLNEARRVGFKD